MGSTVFDAQEKELNTIKPGPQEFYINAEKIRQRVIRSANKRGVNPAGIQLVAVSKTASLLTIKEAYQLGIQDFGENRVQQLIKRQAEIPDARWHLIGHLQTNKVKDIIGKTYLIHSLDRWKLAEYIEKRAKELGIVVSVLLQVNVAGETQKSGLAPAEVEDFLDSLGVFQHLRVKGLMTMAPEVEDPEQTRPVFKELRYLFDSIRGSNYPHVEMKYLSMGMTQDFEVAIEEGANLIRVGRALFGPGV